ncbi:helix-hairpin-helix domain-containing protein [Halalkalibacter nanhaiisediminis]|uniref:Pathogenicity locus Cdd1 protein n=1 Tax=Halalkalibacter nanhaiisediminis TaxID=688079 RepID=A0A562QTV3_9BACI|nr:helix-hairpin-helix domain-containing protein [Halalkalibacter nanhaiisediminis]TWI60043.1 pathogenicity locus Cdd1 protein [Halalkalibacter nanhaiisediminis]
MSSSYNPKLPLTKAERDSLRKFKIKIRDIYHLDLEYLSEILDVTLERANIIRGLAIFQYVPSIGQKLAEKLVYHLQIYSLDDIKGKDGAELFDQLEETLGVWIDGSVEDQIRCVISFAHSSNGDKQWFDFTEERKEYRKKKGYPKSRPTKAWYE